MAAKKDTRDEWMRVSVVARELRVDSNQVYRWCQTGALVGGPTPSGPWRVDPASVERLKASRGAIEEAAGPSLMASPLLTREEVAAWLQVGSREVVRLGVPCIKLSRKILRYDRAEVMAWLRQQGAK